MGIHDLNFFYNCMLMVTYKAILSCPNHRHKMKKSVAGIQTFSFGQDLVFDAFIQFKVTISSNRKSIMIQIFREQIFEFQEYIGFVKCMNAMKGMKLCYKDRDSEKAWTSNIRVSWNALYSV